MRQFLVSFPDPTTHARGKGLGTLARVLIKRGTGNEEIGNEEMDWKWSSFVYSGLLMLLCFDVLIIPSRLRPAGGPDSYLHTQPVHHDPCLNIIQIIMPLRVELARALSISDLVCQ